MNWLARLKAGKTPEKDASKTTKTLFVVSVAPTLVPFQKIMSTSSAATASATMLQMETVVQEAFPPPADTATDDPNRWAWPHSSAMNGAEIDIFRARLAGFTDKGLGLHDADELADKLVRRDRDLDDRRICLECIHLAGQSGAAWYCKNWQRSGVALRARDAQLATALVLQLQRCDGFMGVKYDQN